MAREAKITRTTNETDAKVTFCADGTGSADISTGIGFFDHMLEQFAKHGFFDITVKIKGDLNVDTHHTVEDTGLALGKAFSEALGDKSGITRYGSCTAPMDEALVLCAVDLSGRAYFSCDAPVSPQIIGGMELEVIPEFFRAFATAAGINLHIKLLSGSNAHHIIECIFKCAARALDTATRIEPRRAGIPSTKGVL